MSGTDYTTTPNLGLFKPNYDMDDGQWGFHLNTNADKLDTALSTGAGGMFLPLTGGTMGGPLTLSGNATQPMHAVPLQQLTAATAGGPFLPLSGGAVSGAVSVANSAAIGANGVVGIYGNAHNTGGNGANGHRFDYQSAAGSNGFDIGSTFISIFDTTFVAGQVPNGMATWIVAQSPNDTTHNWSCIIGEMNVVNRGADKGWMRDRTLANPTGGLLMVPEAVSFGGTGGGEGKNATFGYSVSRSAANNSTGFPVKFYNGFLIEPNSVVGLTGRGIYATGDITGTASQYPYGPLQLDGTWLHGIDHTKAVYTDNNAETMAVTQRFAWIVGATGAATATATIGAFGSGSSANIQMIPAPGSSVFIGDTTGAQTLTLAGAPGQSTGIKWSTSNNLRWQFTTDASDNLNLYAYSNVGGFLGTLATFGQGPLGINAQAPLQASSTLAVTGAATLNSGVSFGSQLAPSAADLSKHIAMYGTIYGFNVVSGAINAVLGGSVVVQFTSAGVNGTIGGTTPNAGFFTTLSSTGAATLQSTLRVNGNVGFYNTAPVAKPTVAGAKGSNAALGSLIAALVSQGLITDTTTA